MKLFFFRVLVLLRFLSLNLNLNPSLLILNLDPLNQLSSLTALKQKPPLIQTLQLKILTGLRTTQTLIIRLKRILMGILTLILSLISPTITMEAKTPLIRRTMVMLMLMLTYPMTLVGTFCAK
jgi:hypothetical protein